MAKIASRQVGRRPSSKCPSIPQICCWI